MVIQNCGAACRDGTGCLNKAKYQGYCVKHKGSAREDDDDSNISLLENETSSEGKSRQNSNWDQWINFNDSGRCPTVSP